MASELRIILKFAVDFFPSPSDNQSMSTTEISSELLAQMHEAAVKAMSPVRDPEAMKKACERMDRMSAEVYRTHGLLDIGVPAIRELRDE